MITNITDLAGGKNKFQGHVLIRDKHSREILLSKKNSIHYGNMSFTVAQALNSFSTSDAFVHFMAFGNGATNIDTVGKIVYKSPRVSESYENSANLYNRTYEKILNPPSTENNIEVINGTAYTDLRITCTLGFNEPADQDLFDSSTSNQGDYVFDELALFTFPTDGSNINTSTMLTHVVFHPVQKSQNRIIEIIYTVRVQLS